MSPYRQFEDFFRISIARTEQELEDVQRLRYQVYCLEREFEKEEDCADGLEKDPFDSRSVHAYLRHLDTGVLAATVRLVLADPADPAAAFPIEEHCGDTFDREFRPAELPRRQVAEISRFAISSEFRKRRKDNPYGIPLSKEQEHRLEAERRILPFMTIGLFRAIVEMSHEHGITHWYAVMEPFLMRLLKRFGIIFPPIGPLVEYHGKRQPCLALVDDVLRGIGETNDDVLSFITRNGELWNGVAGEGRCKS
ncbi:MAG: PEP-CTERM/exosortase system-associated acyltransferase [Deferrisomatales bacterium]|nr:PEP-CTERM/exosortase system-associated acyltransferase [Deferrisomatales bacterium]